ncbi:MAG: efflux RND transporter periplasmic adaptor subunit, partial [Candidatus Omnitrophota bacterium]
MRTKIVKITFILMVAGIAFAVWYFKFKPSKVATEIVKEISPFVGTIESIISTTGTVLPKNRLEIKPPVSGRVEEVLVKEGEKVKAGQTVAWMSSTERAAMLDAATGQGEETLKYWKDVYKAISLISPINGEVIVATTQPGQTVATSDAVIVLSDKLIVRAQVDETDIGKIKLNQNANVTLDAYLGVQIKAKVEHIYYESETVNNVTIYKVDLVPEMTPDFFRSGMNATVDFTVMSKENVVLVPVASVRKDKNESYVLLKQSGSENPVKRVVELGITDDKNYEIISGLTIDDIVIVTTKKYTFPSNGN